MSNVERRVSILLQTSGFNEEWFKARKFIRPFMAIALDKSNQGRKQTEKEGIEVTIDD